jgi:hypothetical protein
VIAVTFSPNCEQIVQRLELPRARISEAVNGRHVGVLSKDYNRIVVLQWPVTDRLTLVDSFVTERTVSEVGGRIKTQLHTVMADLVAELRPELPAGTLTRDMNMLEVLDVVARSFGWPVVCSSAAPAAHLYAGPWDGQVPRVSSTSGDIFLTGTYSEDGTCELVWAFDLDRYLAWFRAR